MRNPSAILIAALVLSTLTACGSPPTKSVRTTTTTTTVDESGATSASSHAELRTHVPVTVMDALPAGGSSSSSRTTVSGPAGNSQTTEQSQSTDGKGTTTVRKSVTQY